MQVRQAKLGDFGGSGNLGDKTPARILRRNGGLSPRSFLLCVFAGPPTASNLHQKEAFKFSCLTMRGIIK